MARKAEVKGYPPDNVSMILGYIEVRLRRVALMGAFGKIRPGDYGRLEAGLRKMLRRLRKDIRVGFYPDTGYKNVVPLNGEMLCPELNLGKRSTRGYKRYSKRNGKGSQ